MPATDIRNYALDWGEAKQPSGDGPTWAALGYMKLRETLETVVAGMEAAAQEVDCVRRARAGLERSAKKALSGS